MTDNSNKLCKADEYDHTHYLPSPEEIAAECKRIRDSWTRSEQHRRRAGATQGDYYEW